MTGYVIAVGAALGMAAAVLLAATAAVLPAPRRDRILRALAQYGTSGAIQIETSHPFTRRVRSITRIVVERLGDAVTSDRDRHRLVQSLDYAGNPVAWPLARVIRVRPLAAVATCGFGAAVGQSVGGGSGGLLGALLGLAGGFLLPRILLHNAGIKRQQQLLRSLPDVMDALVIGVEAGLGLDSAMDHVGRSMTGPMSDELRRVLQEMRLGVSRAEALRSLSARTTVRDLKRLVTALVQAGELGISVANILREHAQDQRVRRRQRAEEMAQKVPVKLIFPVMFCMLPAIFVILIGPAVLQLIKSFQ
ncbi:type II secretion system F family protein [Actinoplanes sp. HUAS TT8]|uniref:type II secretion system F family protein n=1 Tax=Actinoplanes sp. HUAS TT8 TaxID=3447453 RepID=UPI003F51E0BB